MTCQAGEKLIMDVGIDDAVAFIGLDRKANKGNTR